MNTSWKIAIAAIGVIASLVSSEVMGQEARPASDSPNSPAPAPQVYPGLLVDAQYRSPGLAVALSLTPLPVDFGNLYAENLGWGMAYTAIEVSLMAPMIWFMGGHMDHGQDNTRSWSDAERNTMIGLVSGYVVVKLGAGLHAGYAARDFNQRSVAIVPMDGGAGGLVSLSF